MYDLLGLPLTTCLQGVFRVANRESDVGLLGLPLSSLHGELLSPLVSHAMLCAVDPTCRSQNKKTRKVCILQLAAKSIAFLFHICDELVQHGSTHATLLVQAGLVDVRHSLTFVYKLCLI